MWKLAMMCRALDVSKTGYLAWRHRPASARSQQDAGLKVAIRTIHVDHRKTYGSPRIHEELRKEGVKISRKRVERLMVEAGIQVRPKARFVVTTDSDHDQPIAPNLVGQDFTAPAPNVTWVTDITYIPTKEGWLFLAALMDVFSRKIVGWAMQPTMDCSLVLKALEMAVGNRKPAAGLIHHSDRGSQYASLAYRQALANHEMIASMSRRACCYDNAAMESFWHTLKTELVYKTVYQTRESAIQEIFEYIEVFYNRTRSHSTIGFLSPAEFEQQHSAVV